MRPDLDKVYRFFPLWNTSGYITNGTFNSAPPVDTSVYRGRGLIFGMCGPSSAGQSDMYLDHADEQAGSYSEVPAEALENIRWPTVAGFKPCMSGQTIVNVLGVRLGLCKRWLRMRIVHSGGGTDANQTWLALPAARIPVVNPNLL